MQHKLAPLFMGDMRTQTGFSQTFLTATPHDNVPNSVCSGSINKIISGVWSEPLCIPLHCSSSATSSPFGLLLLVLLVPCSSACFLRFTLVFLAESFRLELVPVACKVFQSATEPLVLACIPKMPKPNWDWTLTRRPAGVPAPPL